MAEKLIFENFQISSWLEKNLYIRQSKEFFEYFSIAIWSVNTYDNSHKFSLSLDNPVSSYRGKHFKKLLLRAVANRVNHKKMYIDKAQIWAQSFVLLLSKGELNWTGTDSWNLIWKLSYSGLHYTGPLWDKFKNKLWPNIGPN